MMRYDLPADRWAKSSYSADTSGQCVEYQLVGAEHVALGDSKDRTRGAFVFPTAAWSSFVRAVKREVLPGA
ncbi:DUF397 domain-containing protein [Streptomyces acidiscabies]|uniref:DUF397 domain-containing protein n=2 Tax=Streptomyces acidiscabies TaxID=42234 RepID=A0AAP6BLA6_9ACTN|nr:DUF397 domain-containing protein [Streptomyces acidiscabies]MBP5936943.1 DUF397 domain-containing protein [Streptomyces sp. LBUM 1476]MBZ3915021.1 DUF397 domain-containing protein [Streptomyces acidiscabies]MDX2966823.1 DUF397 domain-containing protein [Streptomyces acidiscabies]MDX3025841.1 DUF397 domain-containing protein [Streptomyces acidiscabies]MDX3796810.1 DUF397 domain-containing protein [Streptomyces acidiscabies]